MPHGIVLGGAPLPGGVPHGLHPTESVVPRRGAPAEGVLHLVGLPPPFVFRGNAAPQWIHRDNGVARRVVLRGVDEPARILPGHHPAEGVVGIRGTPPQGSTVAQARPRWS